MKSFVVHGTGFDENYLAGLVEELKIRINIVDVIVCELFSVSRILHY
ncbi:MAG: hypothetical protein JJU37_07390 [Balneolaceae bacterium]|nr:hypothetical protein [Balneolaceae bacterium]